MPKRPNETCWTMVRSASAGDPQARSIFSRTYATTIQGFLSARWLGRSLAGETDDATQEVFMECFKPGGVLDRADPMRGDFRGLLFGVTRNVARRFEERALRQAPQNLENSQWQQQLASDEPGQATLFDQSWARALIKEAKKRHREVAGADGEKGAMRLDLLKRRFGSDEAIRQIAAEWNMPPQELHNAYRKARTEFYACLREVVAFHSPGTADLEAECKRLLASLA
ncbi:MAG: sigma-70 family RNA polymerase sigma factor [Planctomycetota bacterium]|nr:sigma-70 family RNA polymerase sigma factor [Planctomycetota bacterium]